MILKCLIKLAKKKKKKKHKNNNNKTLFFFEFFLNRAPRGFAPWSPRIYESIMVGCVPVILADGIVTAFEPTTEETEEELAGILNLSWDAFRISVRESQLQTLKKTLSSVSDLELERMQKALLQVRRNFSYKPRGYDAKQGGYPKGVLIGSSPENKAYFVSPILENIVKILEVRKRLKKNKYFLEDF